MNEPEPAKAPTPRSPRFETLDLLRGVACVMIVLLHSTMVQISAGRESSKSIFSLALLATSRMAIGVPIFFVISGYCISASADACRRGKFGAGSYFVRRIRRIYPPYLIALCFTIVFMGLVVWLFGNQVAYPEGGAIRDPRTLTLSQWLGNVTLTEEWRHHVFGAPKRYVMVVAWSLCYEEQFYIVMGLLLLLMANRLFTGAAVVSLMVGCIAFAVPAESIRGFFFDLRWFTFAGGILLYWQVNYGGRWAWRVAPAVYLAVFVGAVGLNPSGALMLRTGHPTRETDLLLMGATCFGLWLIHPWDKQIVRSRWLAPLVFCGRHCYSLYLVHSPIVTVVSKIMYDAGFRSDMATVCVVVPACLSLSLLVASGFYRLVERRFINSPLAGRSTSAG